MDGYDAQALLIDPDAGAPPPVITKGAFAEELGLSKARVSQLVAKGLPVRPDGRLDRAAAFAWYAENTEGSRRKALRPHQSKNWREELDRLKAATAALELAKARAALIDRAAAEKAIFERARLERDAHVAFVSRAAPQLAAETGADPAAVFAVLDRLMREHLAALAETPIESLGEAPGDA